MRAGKPDLSGKGEEEGSGVEGGREGAASGWRRCGSERREEAFYTCSNW